MKNGVKVNLFAWVAAVAVLAAAVPINLIFSKVDVKVDVTPYNAFTLSDSAEKTLESITEPVDMYVLYKLDNLYDGFSLGDVGYTMADMFVKTVRMMGKYDNITLHDVDVIQDPDFIKELDPEGYMNLQSTDIVLKSGNNIRRIPFNTLFVTNGETGNVEFYGENYIMGAIDYLQTGKTPTIYFTTGHDEKSIDDYTNLREKLKSQNYEMKPIDISDTGSIPDDATTIVVAAPKKDLTDNETEIISSYLDNGGNICMLMSPYEGKFTYKNIEKIMGQYNIAMDYNKVYETVSGYHAQNNKYITMCEFFDTDINQGLIQTQDVDLYMPPSRSFYSTETDEKKSDMTVEPLIQTYNTASSEICGGTSQDIQPPGGVLYLAAHAENPDRNNSKLFVSGTADIISDAVSENEVFAMTPYTFLTNISWMDEVNSEMLYPIHIQATDYITIPNEKTGNIILVIMIAFPILISITGVIIWARRRNA